MKESRRGGVAPQRLVMRGALVGLAAIALLLGMPAAQTQAKSQGTSFVVNAGSVYANTVDVTLTLQAAGVALVRYRNVGGTFTGWEPYVISRAWVLAPGDGLKSVEAMYRTTSGTVHTLSAPITLDTTAPVVSNDYDGLPHRMVTVTLTAVDSLSGVDRTWFRLDGGAWQEGTTLTLRVWRKKSGLAAGPHTIEYYASDMAGNVGSVETVQVILHS